MTTNEGPGDLTTRVLVEIRDEIRTMREEHGALLRDHGEQLRDHGEQLRDHGEQLRDHGELLRDHSRQLGELRLGQERMGVNVSQILQALESGASRRDDRVVDLERRVDRLEDHAGLPR